MNQEEDDDGKLNTRQINMFEKKNIPIQDMKRYSEQDD